MVVTRRAAAQAGMTPEKGAAAQAGMTPEKVAEVTLPQRQTETEMGRMLWVNTAFYTFTNFGYYPYFVWRCSSVPWWFRVFCEIGFVGGLTEHVTEARGYLKGEKVKFGNPFDNLYSPSDPLIKQWAGWLFIATQAAFAPFGIMVYEYYLAVPDRPPEELAALILFALAASLYGLNSTARGELIGCTRQWHFEHVLVHAGFAFLALSTGGVYDKWESSTLRCHLLFLGAITVLIELAIILMDNKAKKKA